MIKLENVTKEYEDGTIAVDSLNMEIQDGEFLVLIGPSGCGKTTTLKMINRLIPLTEGTIFIDGKKISDYNIHELRWNIGYVLQQIALFPHMTIEENIAIVPELKKWSQPKVKNRITELLEMVGLDPKTYRSRKPSELSGGEQQRVGVVRALAANPDIILMDEPFSALDPISREKLQDDIIELQKNIKKTIVFVTHDMQEAIKLADRICLMNEGNIVQLDTPEEIQRNPSSKFVEEFVGTLSNDVNTTFNLKDYILPLEQNDTIPTTVSMDISLEELLQALTNYEQLGVKENDELIGFVNRQRIIHYFSEHLPKRGAING